MNRNLDWKINESVRVIKFAYHKWQPNIGLAFTGRKDSTVLLDLIQKQKLKLPKIMFIDHGMHLKESLDHLKSVIEALHLDVDWRKDEKVTQKSKIYKGKKLRKLIDEYKIQAIKDCVRDNRWEALFTAIRWDEHPAREKEKYFSEREGYFRVHPLLHWTEEDIWAYIREYNLPYNPLYDMGYRSLEEVGTKKVKSVTLPERSGRTKEKEEVMERLRKLGYF